MGTAERIIEMMKYLCRVRHSTMPELAGKVRSFCKNRKAGYR